MTRTHNSSNSNRIKGTQRQDAAKLHRISVEFSVDQCEVPGLAVHPLRARPGRVGGVEEPAVHGEDVHDRVRGHQGTHDALPAHVFDARDVETEDLPSLPRYLTPFCFAEDLTGRCRLCRLLYDDALHDHLSWAHDLCRVGCTSGRVLGTLPQSLQMAATGSRY